jgi:hypothetical protein
LLKALGVLLGPSISLTLAFPWASPNLRWKLCATYL